VKELDEINEPPREILEKLARMGLMGICASKDYEGMGLDTLSFVLVIENLAKASPGISVSLIAQTVIESLIQSGGNEEQRKKYLPSLAHFEKTAAIGFTEPYGGSDAAGVRTTAKKDGDYYILTGVKWLITNAAQADLFVFSARTNPSNGAKGVSLFIVDRETPGLSIGTEIEVTGLHPSKHYGVTLKNCRVPRENLLGNEGEGLRYALAAVGRLGRIGHASMALGIAQAALDSSIKYARKRVLHGQPIAKFQYIQSMIVDVAAKLEAARLMVYKAAWLRDENTKNELQVSMARLLSAEAAVTSALNAIRIHGGLGHMKGQPYERWLRDAILTELDQGTMEVQKIVVARNLIGREYTG